jgi:hypothetical protein
LRIDTPKESIVNQTVYLATKAAMPALEITHCSKEINPSEVWPKRFCEVELAVRALPK